MKRMKKILLIFAAVAMVSVGVTLAYLQDVTDTVVNGFSSDKRLSLLLREPLWDGFGFDDKYPANTTPGQIANPDVANQELGITKAMNYNIGETIPKNPIVKNTSQNGEQEFVAIKVEYVLINNGMEQIISKADFSDVYAKTISNNDANRDGIHDEFVNISNQLDRYDLYLYGTQANPTVLGAGQLTPYLFDSIAIDTGIVPDHSGKLPNFQIRVTAYAVQTISVDGATAVSELNKLAN